MRIVFFGSGNFAVSILDELIAYGEEILCVVTQPDKKAGRHFKMTSVPVKDYALRHNLLLFQPQDLTEGSVYDYLKNLNADLFITAAYGKILPKRIIELPKLFSLNVHASLLPKFRGAAPINWAIIKGEKETGVSVIKMNEFMDRGDIILAKTVIIEDREDAQILSEKLAQLGGLALIGVVDLVKGRKIIFTKQDETVATYAPKLNKEMGLINWHNKCKDIFNQVRGLVPWPAAYTYFNARLLRIWKATYLDFKNRSPERILKPGEVSDITREGILVCCSDGLLLIQEAQLESGKRMSAYDFALGHKMKSGDVFENSCIS